MTMRLKADCKHNKEVVYIQGTDISLFVDGREANHVIVFECACGEISSQGVNDHIAAELIQYNINRYPLPDELREQHSGLPINFRDVATMIVHLLELPEATVDH
jgi:hypothetical protein